MQFQSVEISRPTLQRSLWVRGINSSDTTNKVSCGQFPPEDVRRRLRISGLDVWLLDHIYTGAGISVFWIGGQEDHSRPVFSEDKLGSGCAVFTTARSGPSERTYIHTACILTDTSHALSVPVKITKP
ncbi:hypothetical protein CIHG_05294 [Coccidioides immitis H538.4]|uniref:Uncharacterized protein n=2 Tax=Coccidioides immitis TaxID=5501 RepID=A0A0J8UJ38_COCIT|nr:hypothetical protein CIRG_08368 [Coccidioides immitis RMSCC 2394]KMU87498.1 hypothetical protein CIHG_05294 [Coccidioides immitis H538.4]